MINIKFAEFIANTQPPSKKVEVSNNKNNKLTEIVMEIKKVFDDNAMLEKISIIQKDIILLLISQKINFQEASVVLNSIDRVKNIPNGLEKLQEGLNEYKKVIIKQ